MSIIRLTERKLRDARFRRKEEARFEAFCDEHNNRQLSAKELAQRAGVNKATLYRHHRAICEIAGDYEDYILGKYISSIQTVRKKGNVDLRRVYYDMIIFILQNKEVFRGLMMMGEFEVIGRMVLTLKPEMMKFVGLSNGHERVLMVHGGEIVGLIIEWGMSGLEEERIAKLINDMMYLSETAKVRLMPLLS